ncbi:pentatricopeptide repeat-containing protein At5g66631-like [Pyrus communis]|uniref:pentatricopeptide repeat-containing protein At5g66631-like n=1 Tax=Pyrus communis TaxID=23211 RepID=UPI0035C25581
MEVFNVLPLMRVNRTLNQFSVLAEACVDVEQFDEDKNLLNEIRVDGILPGHAMRLSLERIQKAGFVHETYEFLREMLPNDSTFSGLMHHFALNADIKTVQKLFAMVRQSGVQPDVYMFKVLIQAYCKCGRAALALRKSCEEVSNTLPLTLPGRIWTLSSADLTKAFSIYSSSFSSAGE